MLKKIRKMKHRKGLTLIELVIVVAILGILATIAIPRLKSVTDEATNKADLASARTIASAVSIAINESRDTEDIVEEDINKYLSNIEVKISEAGNPTSNDWFVVFSNSDDIDFEIYKGEKILFPIHEEIKDNQ